MIGFGPSNIGTRVYHTKLRANGVITAFDPDKRRDKYKVEFFWAKYCKDILHGETWHKWQWCEEANLVETEWPTAIPISGYIVNKVTSIGGRSLDRLIRTVCEIPRRSASDGSDVVIVYGQSNHSIPESVFTINRHLIGNKFQQMKLLSPELGIESTHDRPADGCDWIIKPQHSMGGRNIRPCYDDEYAGAGEYYQRKFNKVREFRAHCFLWMDEPVTFIQEKFIEDKEQLTWNKKQGGKFRFAYQEGMPNFQDLQYSTPISLATVKMLQKASVKALKALKYDFGGIDFGMDVQGNLKIFEVNSRMGLLEQSLFTYKRAFTKLRTLNINQYKQERWS